MKVGRHFLSVPSYKQRGLENGLKRIVLMEMLKIGAIGFLICICIGAIAYIPTFISPFSKGDWESHGVLMFVNVKDQNTVIVKQHYNSGAWDSESRTRIVKLNLTSEKTERVTIEQLKMNEWIRVYCPWYKWRGNDIGVSFGPERFRGFMDDCEKNGKLIFKHKSLNAFSRILEPIDSYPELMENWRTYCDNSFSGEFKAYVFCKNSSLVLYTVGNDQSKIDMLTLFQEESGENYSFKRHSFFTAPNKFAVVIIYKTFRSDSLGVPILESIKGFEVINKYEIRNNGIIEKTNSEEFGEIIIKPRGSL